MCWHNGTVGQQTTNFVKMQNIFLNNPQSSVSDSEWANFSNDLIFRCSELAAFKTWIVGCNKYNFGKASIKINSFQLCFSQKILIIFFLTNKFWTRSFLQKDGIIRCSQKDLNHFQHLHLDHCLTRCQSWL